MCQAWGAFPQKKQGYGLWVSALACLHVAPGSVQGAEVQPGRQARHSGSFAPLLLASALTPQLKLRHPSPHPSTKATVSWAFRYKKPRVYGQNGNQLTLVETVVQLNP